KIEVEELAQTSRREPLFRFVQERPSGKEVLEVESVSKAFGPKVVLNNVSLTVRRGEKLAVIGPNGLGKSTLLKIVMDRLKADQGTRILEVTPEGPGEFPGTYAEYLARAGDDHLDIDAVSLKAKSSGVGNGGSSSSKAANASAAPGLSWEEQKKRRNKLGTLPA